LIDVDLRLLFDINREYVTRMMGAYFRDIFVFSMLLSLV
jgi:hypothetical protein